MGKYLCFIVAIISLFTLGVIIFGILAYKQRPKNKVCLIIATTFALLLIITIPFLINELYITNSGYTTLWGASDVVSFYGTFIAFLGTVSLGVLSLCQNIKFKNASNAKDVLFLKIEKEKIRLSNLPQFLIQTADIEKCIDSNYLLSAQNKENYIALKKFKTYAFFIESSSIKWLPEDKYPIIKFGTGNRLFSIVNCGNNTAHQVKLSVSIGNKKYDCEKATSIIKDDDIFFYFGINTETNIQEKIILIIRFFDCFQNIYEQKFEIINEPNCLYLKSFTDVSLIQQNSSMEIF